VIAALWPKDRRWYGSFIVFDSSVGDRVFRVYKPIGLDPKPEEQRQEKSSSTELMLSESLIGSTFNAYTK